MRYLILYQQDLVGTFVAFEIVISNESIKEIQFLLHLKVIHLL